MKCGLLVTQGFRLLGQVLGQFCGMPEAARIFKEGAKIRYVDQRGEFIVRYTPPGQRPIYIAGFSAGKAWGIQAEAWAGFCNNAVQLDGMRRRLGAMSA